MLKKVAMVVWVFVFWAAVFGSCAGALIGTDPGRDLLLSSAVALDNTAHDVQSRMVRVAIEKKLVDDDVWPKLLSCTHPGAAKFVETLNADTDFSLNNNGFVSTKLFKSENNRFEAVLTKTVLWKVKKSFKKKSDSKAMAFVKGLLQDGAKKTGITKGTYHTRFRLALYIDQDGREHLNAFVAEDSSPLPTILRSCPEKKLKRYIPSIKTLYSSDEG